MTRLNVEAMQDEPQRKYHKRKRPDTPLEKQRAKTWTAFSRFIRLRDCLQATGTIYRGKCCTCGKEYPIGKLQAGHFMPGRMDSVLFDEDQAHAQCYRCNVLLSGMWPAYYRFMEERHGKETIDVMIQEWFDAARKRDMTEPQLRSWQVYYEREAERLQRQRSVSDDSRSIAK